MTSNPDQDTADTSNRSAAHMLHSAAHFLRVVRFRQSILISSVIACGMLGGLYYATAVRQYQAKASLLVLQTGADVTNTTMSAEGVRQGLMPTYERLLSSAVVLDGAIKYLDPADRLDLAKDPPETWTTLLRARLTASTVRLTNIIEISYRSQSPHAAVAVVNAVLRSYLEFMDKTHKGTAGELINVFTKEKAQLEERLSQKQEEVLAARQRFGDLGIRSDSHVVHPLVQRVIELNQAVIKAQQYRLEQQAVLNSILSAIQNGEDLQQQLLSLESGVGRELLMSGLGFNNQDIEMRAKTEMNILADQAELQNLQQYFGPAHPRIATVNERIRINQQYLASYQSRIQDRLAQTRNQQLGPLLQQMQRQRLNEAWQHESALRASFEQARGEAVRLVGDRERLQLMDHDLKFLQELRDVLLNKIASVDLRQDHGDIRTAVVGEPLLPKYPVWPKLPLVVGASLIVGVCCGLGLIYVLDIMDDRFRSPEELRAELGAPVLAMIRQLQDLGAVGLEGLQVHVAPDDLASEAFRTLRTTLAFSGKESSRLVVSSAEPGDGKTTVLANLAISFCQSAKRTLLIDADMRRPGMSALMGLRGQAGLSDLLTSTDPFVQAVAPLICSMGHGLDFLPAGARRPNPAELLGGSRLTDLLAWADSRYDQILIDSPPILAAADATIIGRLVDGVVLVVQPKKNRRRMVVRAAESFTSVGIQLLGVVLNRIGGDKSDTIYGYGAEYGYGYGYGYGHGYGPDSNDQAADKPNDRAADDPTPPAPATPRRVA